MRRSKIMINRALIAAPWATIAALMVLSAALPNRASISQEGIERHAAIAQEVKTVSNYIGRWSGADGKPMAPEAQQLLKPNAILNRRYTSPGGPWVHLVIVHCGDSRDMIGHFPPVCYPSAGWTTVPATMNTAHTLNVRNQPFPVREYAFRGYLEDGREESIRILNAFVLPDGAVTRDIADISKQSERLSVAVQGVAQVQIITSARVRIEEAIGAAEEILNGLTGLFDALQLGQGAAE